MILVTTSRKADPLVRRIGRDIAFASGGRYLTRGKGGLSSPPFCEGILIVLSRDRGGIRVEILDSMEELASLRFGSVRDCPNWPRVAHRDGFTRSLSRGRDTLSFRSFP